GDAPWPLAYLARFGRDDAWVRLRSTATSAKPEDRRDTAVALSHVRHPRTVDILLPMLDDRTVTDRERGYDVRGAARWALWRLTGQDFGTDRARWEAWWKEQKGVLPPKG